MTWEEFQISGKWRQQSKGLADMVGSGVLGVWWSGWRSFSAARLPVSESCFHYLVDQIINLFLPQFSHTLIGDITTHQYIMKIPRNSWCKVLSQHTEFNKCQMMVMWLLFSFCANILSTELAQEKSMGIWMYPLHCWIVPNTGRITNASSQIIPKN